MNTEQVIEQTAEQVLSDEQFAAVESSAPAILMMAGAGSGKTHVLIERTKRLVANKQADASRMVIITFTNQAANELKSRSRLAYRYCGTLHGYMLRILQEHGNKIGLGGQISVITEDTRDDIIKELRVQFGCKQITQKKLTEALALGHAKLCEMASGVLNLAQTVALGYYQRCISESMMDYDSILQFGLELVSTMTADDLETDYIFVDEYQDSSVIDAAIYKALPIPHKFYVGDTRQAIYGFRGGDIGNILREAANLDTEVLFLRDNYRSDKSIVRATNNLITHNADAVDLPPSVAISAAEGKVLLQEPFPHELEELCWLAQKINAQPDPNEVAVLVRTNKLVEFFRDGLRGHGCAVPAHDYKRLPADYSVTVKFLSYLCNPDGDHAAHAYLAAVNGRIEADAARMEALSQFRPLSEIHPQLRILRSIKPAKVLTALKWRGTSDEMLDIVKDVVEQLPHNYTLAEVVTALRFPEKKHAEGVTVCTMHAAKGREWNTVFLPAFEQGIIPTTRRNSDINEERRLAYVAMTRARHELVISHSEVRSNSYAGYEEVAQGSQFIGEVNRE